MDSFADRLESLIGGKRQISAFARKCGIGDTTLRQYLDGAMPRLDKVIQIAKATGTSINWLATGEGAGDSSADPSHVLDGTEQERGLAVQHVDLRMSTGAGMVLLPLLEVQASAGSGMIAQSERTLSFVAFSETYLRELGVNPRSADVLQVTGRSMMPTLADRDWVVVDRSIDHVVDEALYAVVYGGMVLVKRVRLSRDGSVTLSSDNKAEGYGDETIRPPDLHTLQIVGRVKAHCRPL